MVKRVLKYATGADIPEEAEYVWSTTNGVMDKEGEYMYVWHYFLVEVQDEQ